MPVILRQFWLINTIGQESLPNPGRLFLFVSGVSGLQELSGGGVFLLLTKDGERSAQMWHTLFLNFPTRLALDVDFASLLQKTVR